MIENRGLWIYAHLTLCKNAFKNSSSINMCIFEITQTRNGYTYIFFWTMRTFLFEKKQNYNISIFYARVLLFFRHQIICLVYKICEIPLSSKNSTTSNARMRVIVLCLFFILCHAKFKFHDPCGVYIDFLIQIFIELNF